MIRLDARINRAGRFPDKCQMTEPGDNGRMTGGEGPHQGLVTAAGKPTKATGELTGQISTINHFIVAILT